MDGKKLNSTLAGVAGEYFVAAELTRMGYIASITLRNTRGVDILCSNSEANRTVGVQVKTNRGMEPSWILNKKSEDYFAENLFYVFVNLNSDEIGAKPKYFIVPSKIVSKFAKENHEKWLEKPRRDGDKHTDTNMRKFEDRNCEYLNKWNLLGI